MKPAEILFLLTILLSLSTNVRAGELSADEIVAKANQAAYYAGNDGKAEVEMVIDDGQGNIRERRFTILRLNTAGQNQKFYVYFKAPPDVRKMAYLVWKNVGANDDRWLWLPALNLVKRIAPGDKRTSFVGSDFVYEDVSGRGLHEDAHELVNTTDTMYEIKNVPVDPSGVEFSYYTVWIDRKTFLPLKAEYYDRNDKLYRVVEATKVDSAQGYPTVLESVARDLRTSGHTRNTFRNVKYDINLDERLFTERFLRRPPREVVQ